MGRREVQGKFSKVVIRSAMATTIAAITVIGAATAAAEGAPPAPPSATPDPEPEVMAVDGTPEVPETMPQPYAVMVFENRSGIRSYDWLTAAIPFVVGERLEGHRGLRPVYGPLVIPRGAAVVANPSNIVAFAAKNGARFVFTGWLKRMPNWDLQLGMAVWKVESGAAVQIHEVVGRDDFKYVHRLSARALEELCAEAGIPLDRAGLEAVRRVPTTDHYAFTLFGRGLTLALGTGVRADLIAAHKNLMRSIFIDPTMAEAQRVIGELYLQVGKRAKARGRLEYALSIRSDYYAALASLAKLHDAEGALERVRDLDRTMLQARPWDLERRYDLGRVLWATGDVQESYRELERVVAHRPDDVRARRVLVLIHASRGAGADLVTELEKVAKLDPNDPATRLDLGAAYASVGRTKDAIATYEQLISTHPRDVDAIKFLGDLHRESGDTKSAIRYYRRAMKVKPSDPRSYFLLGGMFVELGNDHAAKRVYLRAQRFKDYYGEVRNSLGAIAYRQGKYGESLWYLLRAVRARPKRASYRYNLALTLSASKHTRKALAQTAAGLALAPDHADLHFLRGVVLLRLGRATDAQAEFERALVLEPTHEDAKYNLVLLEQMRRRAEQGEVVVEGR